jgi:formiminoglutamase
MTLPLLLSVPHAGLRIPPEVRGRCVLTPEEVVADGDDGAAEIYDLNSEVAAYVATDVARAIVDLNRAEEDRSKDGVVKTHTCWDVPVYGEPLPDELTEALLDRYYRPYHERLTNLGRRRVRLGIDCHTMAAAGPPVGPDPGADRPWICLGNAEKTCPGSWLRSLADCFERAFGVRPSLNDPFRGGHIVRRHSTEMPWVQLEISRGPFLANEKKRERVLAALTDWCGV